MLQAIELHKANVPFEYDLDFLREWMKHPRGGKLFLRDREKDVWHPKDDNDFLALSRAGGEKDFFSKWFTNRPLKYFQTVIGHKFSKPRKVDEESGIVDYKDEDISLAVDVLGTVLASLLPVVSTIVLYFLRTDLARLGAIAGFMTLSSTVLAVFTKARRIEIFGATVALVP